MKKSGTTLIVLLVISSLLVILSNIETVTAEPRTIVVPDDYSTIQEAIDGASEGDTVFVKNGIYIESVTIDKALALEGENKESTVIDGNNTGPTILIRHDGVNVTGFKIRNVEDPPPFSDSRGRLAGIHLLDVRHCRIYGNNVVNCGKGVWLHGSSDNNIITNSFSGNNYGVLLESSNNNIITVNTISDGWGGIWIENSENNMLRDNNMLNNVQNFGILGSEISHYNNDVDLSNLINSNRVYRVIDETNLIIDPSSFPDVGYLLVINCTGITVQSLQVTNNYVGIHLVGSPNCTLTQNVVSNNTCGIWVQLSQDCVISENEVESNSDWGIRVDKSDNSHISHNYMEYNQLNGIVITGSDNNLIVENNIAHGFDGSEGFNGISLLSSSNNQIVGNSILGNENCAGINLKDSSNNLVKRNLVDPGALGINIREESNYNEILENTLLTDMGSWGIVLFSSFNVLTGNNVTNFYTGIKLSGENNTVTQNIFYSKERAIEVFPESNNNTFIMNNFQGGTEIFDFSQVWQELPVNIWDDGEKGNYWENYKGIDNNGDGTGDTPYIINEKNQDNHPLMEPVIIPEFPPWILLPLFLIATLFALVIKKKLSTQLLQ